jgi:hypothetical protein
MEVLAFPAESRLDFSEETVQVAFRGIVSKCHVFKDTAFRAERCAVRASVSVIIFQAFSAAVDRRQVVWPEWQRLGSSWVQLVTTDGQVT